VGGVSQPLSDIDEGNYNILPYPRQEVIDMLSIMEVGLLMYLRVFLFSHIALRKAIGCLPYRHHPRHLFQEVRTALSQDLSIALLVCPFHFCVLLRQNCSLKGEFLRSRMFGCLEMYAVLAVAHLRQWWWILLPESIDGRRRQLHKNALCRE
jgi:hypothetical protein